jgi:hypothetical protein
VVVTYNDNDHSPHSVQLAHGSGNNWAGLGPNARNGSNYLITATDDAGLTTTQPITMLTSCAG